MRLTAQTLLVVCMLWTLSASGAIFQTGNVIVSGYVPGDGFLQPTVGKIREFAPAGSLVQELSGISFDIKFSPSGVLHGASGDEVIRFASDGSAIAPLGPVPGYFMLSLAFDNSGRLFGTTASGKVVKFDNGGNLAGVFVLGMNTQWADLGRDQCTLYHFGVPGLGIGRANVCNNTILSPLPTVLNDFGRTLLVLSDDTLLVSTDHADMYHIKNDGTVLRHYATHAIAYGRDSNPNFAWVVTIGKVAKFDLQDDLFVTVPFDAGVGVVSGIAIVGADVQSVPILAPWLLMFFGFVLACAATMRLRT